MCMPIVQSPNTILIGTLFICILRIININLQRYSVKDFAAVEFRC